MAITGATTLKNVNATLRISAVHTWVTTGVPIQLIAHATPFNTAVLAKTMVTTNYAHATLQNSAVHT
jgi:hypothetical protein